MTDSLRIFLAHAGEDKPQVRQLYQQLHEAGYQPWMDEVDLIPGQNWRDEIPKAIKGCDIFIACLSSRSVSKQGYVQREFRLALNQLAEVPAGEIYLIPLKLDDCEIPDLRQGEYGVNLRDIQWLDYGEAGGWEKLLQAINHKTGEDVMIDWRKYLDSICETYSIWWKIYTITDVTARNSEPKKNQAPLLDLGLKVELVSDKKNNGIEEQNIERLPVLDGLRKYAKDGVLLQGKPGSGKSTALIRLLLEKGKNASQKTEFESQNLDRQTIPILVELRDYKTSIFELIKDFLLQHDSNLDFDKNTLENCLRQGGLLLLFDGVNELPSKEARDDLQQFWKKHRKNTAIVFTTRELGGLGGNFEIEKKLTMQPLTSAQMERFVCCYLPEKGQQMLKILGERLKEFGQIPLLLWMLCSVFDSNQQQIPSNLGLVFRRFTELYDSKLKINVRTKSDSKDLWADSLKYLAFAMIENSDNPIISRDEAEEILGGFLQSVGEADYSLRRCRLWLQDLLDHHLLQPRGDRQIEFRHQLIQGYYAAEGLLGRVREFSDEVLQRDYLNYLKWTEPFALMLSLLEDEKQMIRVVEKALELDCFLGARLAGAVIPKWQKKTIELIINQKLSDWVEAYCWGIAKSEQTVSALIKALNHENYMVCQIATLALGEINSSETDLALIEALNHSDFRVRLSAAEVLGGIGCEDAIPSLIKNWQCQDFFVSRSAEKALVKIGSEKVTIALVEALNYGNFSVRNRAAEALGEIGTEAACSPLIKSLKGDLNPDVRTSAAEALGKIGSEQAIPDLITALNDHNPWVYFEAVKALTIIGSKKVISALKKALNDNDCSVCVRGGAAEVLGEIGSEQIISDLKEVLIDRNHALLRSKAAEALGKIGSEHAVQDLIATLNDQNFAVHCSAALALGEIGSEQAIPALINALNHEDSEVRYSAAEALGKIISKQAFPDLITALDDQDPEVGEKAIEDLGKIISEKAFRALITALNDQDSDVRWVAIEALEKIGSEQAASDLIMALDDQDPEVGERAAEALSKIASERAVPGLITALNNQEPDVRERIIDCLGKIGSEQAMPVLINALNSEDTGVCCKAAQALGRISSERAIPELKNALNHDNSKVHYSAAEALNKIGSEEAVPALIKTLNDQEQELIVRLKATEALGNIGSEKAIFPLIESINKNSDVYWNAIEALNTIQGHLQYYRPRPTTIISNQKVFISYAWEDESETIANQIEEACFAHGIKIIRDKKDLGYKGRIKRFMKQIGLGDCIIVIISDKYLKSEDCMFELLEIYQTKKPEKFYESIFPIVLPDAQIRKASNRLKYLRYWEQETNSLEKEIKEGSITNLDGITDDLDLYDNIRRNLPELTNILKDINTLTPESHYKSNYEEIINAIKIKLSKEHESQTKTN